MQGNSLMSRMAGELSGWQAGRLLIGFITPPSDGAVNKKRDTLGYSTCPQSGKGTHLYHQSLSHRRQ